MSRKHFEAIAAILANYAETFGDPTQAHDITFADVVDAMADYFASENPRFDRDRFRKACGL